MTSAACRFSLRLMGPGRTALDDALLQVERETRSCVMNLSRPSPLARVPRLSDMILPVNAGILNKPATLWLNREPFGGRVPVLKVNYVAVMQRVRPRSPGDPSLSATAGCIVRLVRLISRFHPPPRLVCVVGMCPPLLHPLHSSASPKVTLLRRLHGGRKHQCLFTVT